jgi:predicted lipoprotein with Yx(FWY)xxD motif
VRIRSRVLPAAAAVALLAAACGEGEEPELVDDDETEDVDDDPDADDEVVDDDTDADDDANDEAAEDDDLATEDEEDVDEGVEDDEVELAVGNDELQVAESDLGEHIVDGDGMTLYVSVLDGENEPECVGDCATVWPALGTEGEPSVSDDLDEDLLDTVERDDGVTQVTYAGHPLYLFVSDGEEGDVNGQEINDQWFVLDPEGEPIGDVPDDDEIEELDMEEEEG